MDLSKLAAPFPAEDIKWRVGSTGVYDGKPWARLVAYIDARLVPVKAAARRRPGGSKGRIRIAADFDAPLPADVLAGFTGTKR